MTKKEKLQRLAEMKDPSLRIAKFMNDRLSSEAITKLDITKGEKGDPGYTPIKGIDYFDGKDGYTPRKGIDYFDGIDGKTPTKEELRKLIIPLIPEPIKGDRGADGRNGIDATLPQIEDLVRRTKEEINKDPIHIKDIKGTEQLIQFLKLGGFRGGGGSGGSSTSITLQTDGVNNGSQSLLNLIAGTNITLSDDGVGGITITAIGDGTGTVTDVSVVTANGLSGSVANSTTTPEITLSTTVTGLLKGNGTAISAATSGTDYAPATSGTGILKGNGSGGFSTAVLNTDYANVTTRLDQFASPNTNVSWANNKITSLSDPTSAQDAATKAYVDNIATGLSWKTAVRVATTTNGTLATAYANGQTVDGIVLATGDRILIKNQTAQTENGIYIVAASGAPTRSTDADTGSELVSATVVVTAGTTNADTQWTCTNDSITIGVTNITFVQISGAGTYAAGTGLSLVGNTFSVNTSQNIATLSNLTTNGYVKTSGGVGTLSVATSIPASDISSGQALSKTDDTNVTLTLGGTPTTALLQATSLTLGWTGTLAKSRGGTGSSDYTTATETLTNKTLTSSTNVLGGVTMTLGSDASYDMYYRNSSGVLTRLANGTTGQVLTATTSGAPSWGSAPAASSTSGVNAGPTGMGTTVVTHGLGRTPVTIRFAGIGAFANNSSAFSTSFSNGIYTSSGNSCVYMPAGTGGSAGLRTTTYCIWLYDGSSAFNRGSVTAVSSTTFTITWVDGTNLSTAASWQWEAQ